MKKVSITTLASDQQEQLRRQPESGMGYQIIGDPVRQNFSSGPLTVVTSGHVLHFEDVQNTPIITNITEIKQVQISTLALNDLTVVQNPKYWGAPSIPPGSNVIPAGADWPPYLYFTKPGDQYIRLSAYQNDWRIGPNGQLSAGTYATTVDDITVVPSGIAAVGRYALPNHQPAIYKFRITPPVGTLLFFGTVTPNYGMCGGGAEVYFSYELPAGSAEYIGTIAEM